MQDKWLITFLKNKHLWFSKKWSNWKKPAATSKEDSWDRRLDQETTPGSTWTSWNPTQTRKTTWLTHPSATKCPSSISQPQTIWWSSISSWCNCSSKTQWSCPSNSRQRLMVNHTSRILKRMKRSRILSEGISILMMISMIRTRRSATESGMVREPWNQYQLWNEFIYLRRKSNSR